MVGGSSISDVEFRDELRAFLARHPPAHGDVRALREWQRTLHADGWVGIHWPADFGGRAATPAQIAIYNEELARAGAQPLPGRVGLTLVGPTLIAHGTDEQRCRWMPRILSGDDLWCQLFSEPGAGSDLVSLSTRAERHGDGYRVNGRKVWSSHAGVADMGIALVRTDPSVRAHKGISMLAIPMDSAGVEVRPLRQMTGECEFDEVFLDDVVVPAANVIGPENEGWAVANTVLANERGASFIWREHVLQELAVGALVDACPPNAVARQRVAQSWIDAKIFGMHNARIGLGTASSVVKLFWAESSRRLYETATDVDRDVRWEHGLLSTRANSIQGGTSEIQRNIIGERLLGLPREPRSSFRRPEAPDPSSEGAKTREGP
jgi:alkylation response protein AidB-like acyl-CoA dehydrogenase